MTLWLLLGLLLGSTAQAGDFRSYLDQARFFIKKGWQHDALEQLELAVATDDGRVDPEAWFMLATVRYELCDVEGAKDAAQRAHSYSRDDDQLQSAAALNEFMKQQFGMVELTALQPGYSRVEVKLQSPLFDPELKKYLERLEEKFKKGTVMLPHRLGLPVGKYVVNGAKVDVAANGDQKLLVNRIDKGPVAVQVTQVELAAGVSLWTAKQTQNLLPAPTTQLSVSQPVGRVVLGAMLDWTPRPYGTNAGITVSGNAFGVGGRAGIEWPGTEPLAIRTSVGYSYALFPGVETRCTDAAKGFSCKQQGPSEMLVYPVAKAHIPHFETLVVYANRTQETNVGLGLKTAVDYAFVRFPAEAEARDIDTDNPVAYAIPENDRGFSTFGVRVMANLLVGF